jgi:RNA polymerase sigma-70 factor (ECF subfamily)
VTTQMAFKEHETDAGVLSGRFVAKPASGGGRNDPIVRAAVERAKTGDKDAVRFLYIRFADNIYGYVRSILRDDHDAEDVTQQVFTKLLKSIKSYEQREVPFTAWILRVAHNLAVDHIRQRRAIPCEDVRMADESHDGSREEKSRRLKEALAGLPEDQREVVVLRHVLGLSPGEIAERLGKSTGSIHGLHHRGRAALKALLTEAETAPVVAGSR